MTVDRKKTDIQKIKNGYIELCRFLFCCLIVLHHCETGESENPLLPASLAPSGYLAVEFFFFLSGCFTMKHLCQERREVTEKMRYAMEYTLGKLKRIFPYAACGTLICFGWRIFSLRSDPEKFLWAFASLPGELFLLLMTGITSAEVQCLNPPLWYLSAILIVLPIVIYLGLRAKDVFRHYLIWFLPPLIHGWMILKLGSVGNWKVFLSFGLSGLLRAFADLLLGCAIYLAGSSLKKRKGETGNRGLWTVAELLLLLGCVALMFREPDAYLNELAIWMLAVSMTITVSGISLSGRLRGSFLEFLGKLSLPVYCVHWWVMQMVQGYAKDSAWSVRLGMLFAGSILLALLVMLLVEKGKKKRGKHNADI